MADSNTLQQASSKRNWLMNERNEWMKLQVFQGAGITDGAGIGRSRFLSCILDSKTRDSPIHKKKSWTFRISHAKIPQILESGFPYMGKIVLLFC